MALRGWALATLGRTTNIELPAAIFWAIQDPDLWGRTRLIRDPMGAHAALNEGFGSPLVSGQARHLAQNSAAA